MPSTRFAFWPASTTHPWSLLKQPSSTSPAVVFALWWSMLTTGICFRKSALIRKKRLTSRRRRFGTSLSKLCAACAPSTFDESCTATWKARTFSCFRTCRPSSATWTFLKSLKKAFPTRKQELPTTRRRRFGKTCPTTPRATFGHLAASCTRCAPWCPRFELTTCKVFTKK